MTYPTSYVQLLFHTNSAQRELVSGILNNFNRVASQDKRISRAFPTVENPMSFTGEFAGSIHDSDYNMHISLSHSIQFKSDGAKMLDRFMQELEKVSRYDRFAPESKNPHFLLLKELKGGPMKVDFEPRLTILPDSLRHKLFLAVQCSPQTKQKLELLINYVDSLMRKDSDFRIKTRKYSKYHPYYLHSSIGRWTPNGEFKDEEFKAVNEILAKDPAYRVDEALLSKLQFDVRFFMASKSFRSIRRVPLPR